MFDLDNLLQLGVFNQLIPVWQVFFFITSLLPFLLWNRVKICLLITYLFTYYLGFMVQWGDYLSTSGTMQPFVLYSFSGLAIAVFFVATIFSDTSQKNKARLTPFKLTGDDEGEEIPAARRRRDPVEVAINVTPAANGENR